MTKRRYKAQSNIDSFIFLYTTRKLTNTVLKYQLPILAVRLTDYRGIFIF